MNTLLPILIIFNFSFSFSQEVAITIDDAPMASSSVYTGNERTKNIIQALKKHNLKTVFFSNSSKFEDKDGKPRLLKYANAGHYIANHTHSHEHASQLEATEYIEDINIADKNLSEIKNFQKWFRFPFLDQGNNHKKRDQIFKWLYDNNYKIGYVTIDTFDWYINSLLQNAVQNQKEVDFEKLKKTYIKYIIDCSKIFNEKSLKLFNEPIKHTLLIHENDLTGLFLDDLLDAYKKLGWKLIDPKVAIEQPAFNVQLKTLKNNDGFVIAKESLTNPKATAIDLNSYDYDYLDKEFGFLK